MQNILAGMAIGSIATAMIGYGWHLAACATYRYNSDVWNKEASIILQDSLSIVRRVAAERNKAIAKLAAIHAATVKGKSGTARKIAAMSGVTPDRQKIRDKCAEMRADLEARNK